MPRMHLAMSELAKPRRAPQREKVRDLAEQGLSPRLIALHLGISTQRVYQHFAAIRQENEAEEEAS